MKNRFSADEARAQLQGPVGFAFDLEDSFEEAAVVGGLASSADAFINKAVKCFLVGFDEPGHLLVQKSIAWYSSAISTHDIPIRHFEGGTEASRLYGLALAKWLAGEQSVDEVRESLECRENYLSGRPGRDRVEVGLVLVEYLDGGRTDLIIAHVDRLWRGKKLPLEVATIVKLCDLPPGDRRRLEVISLLRSSADEWLSRGHWSRFATWVKIGTRDQPDKATIPVVLREMLELATNGRDLNPASTR
jgi:hypothetical protein